MNEVVIDDSQREMCAVLVMRTTVMIPVFPSTTYFFAL